MIDLKRTHPDVYEAFANKGLFPVRRTDGVWSGIFTDLVIEQVLMAGLKTSGGLTRGFNESTRLLFLLSRPICAEIGQSIFYIAGLSSDEQDGHRDLTAARIQRDMPDIKKLLDVFFERGVFSTASEKLVSLSTGLVADDLVNADEAKTVGDKILQSMVGETVSSYSFTQKAQVKTLASAVYVKAPSGGRIEMDPQRLYQHLLLMGIGDIPLPELLKYELYSLPASLYDNHMRMRTGNKAELMHHLLRLVPESVLASVQTTGFQFVIDGGGLLHKFSWPKHSTYSTICNMYVQHVSNTYGQGALVVFDGYQGPRTKDETHRRRTGNDVGASVVVSAEMRLTMTEQKGFPDEWVKQTSSYPIACCRNG